MRRSALLSLLCSLAIAAAPAAGGEPAGADVDSTLRETVAAAPRWSVGGEPSDGGYRLSLVRAGVDVGLDFQRRDAAARSGDARFDSAAPAGAMLPSLSLGLRSVGAPTASSLVDRTLAPAAPAVSRVGIEYKPAQSQVFLKNGLGLRLSGDDRLTMRLKKGSLGVYLKNNF